MRVPAVGSIVGRVLDFRFACGPSGKFRVSEYAKMEKAKYQFFLGKPFQTEFADDFDKVVPNLEEGFMFASNLCLLIAVLWAKGRSRLPWLHENASEREPDRTTPRGEANEIVYEAWQEFVTRLRGRLDETTHQQHLRNAQMSQRKCDREKNWKKNGKTTMHEASEGKRNDWFGITVSDAETKLNLSGKQCKTLLRVV
ncbi:hypothetical protein EDB85DRAFT_2232138 [Lactarius pseudohatsudake]|nr:hypothetical protein EDB85DRAFT_2232138 [Lactarius pseudohatsudake]